MRKLSTVVFLAALLVFLTRWPLIPKMYLYHVDNVNFALALDDFNPVLHRPQPPGDPLFVVLIRLLHLAIKRPEVLLPVSGIIGSVLAVTLMWRLASEMFGARPGIAAALLLALNPVFWLAGVGNYVRVYLALGALSVAWLAWRCWTAERLYSPRWFYSSAAALGFFAGFRPELGVLLFPLVASSVKIREFSFRQCLTGFACLAATTVPWLAATAYATGGLSALYRLNSAYLAEQSSRTSVFYGASLPAAAYMSAGAVYWIFLGALSWFWIVPWTGLRSFPTQMPLQVRFLALWFVPPFLFHVLIHINNPDHALAEIPVVCLLGSALICRVRPRASAAVLAAAAAINVVLFFYPKESPFWASNYRLVEYTDNFAHKVYSNLRELQPEGMVTVLWKNSLLTPQELTYYVPGIPVTNLAALPRGAVITVAPGALAWLDPVSSDDRRAFASLQPDQKIGPLYVIQASEGERFTVDGHDILVAARR